MTQKLAIFEEEIQAALMGSCESDNEYIPIWLMLKCGMHPSDVSQARDKIRFNGQFIEWKRAKNANPRREIVPKDTVPRLERWLKQGRKLTRVGYNQLVHRVSSRIGHPEYSPLTLRHTFGLQELRRFMNQHPQPPDLISLVAVKMGCRKETVIQYYIDLTQWESLGDSGHISYLGDKH